VFEGSGLVQANGGNAQGLADDGGGGGGRIAVYVGSCHISSGIPLLSANGGAGYRNGKTGTIYLDSLGLAAGVIASTGGVQLDSPPLSLQLNAYQSDTVVRDLKERQSYILQAALDADVSASGLVTTGGQLSPTSIPASTRINSHVIHFDPINVPDRKVVSMTYDTDILGVVTSSSKLDASDAALGLPWVSYPNGTSGRGIDFTGGAAEQDTLTLSLDKRTLTLSLGVSSGMDELRVITATRPGYCQTVGVSDPPIGGHIDLPKAISFSAPFPNPSRSGVHFRIGLPKDQDVRLEIYSVDGRRLATLADGNFAAGWHTLSWQANRGDQQVASGIYFARMTAARHTEIRRLMVIR
jgi:hypothetical protein